MVQGQEPPAVWWFWSFPAWCLGFVSGFEFRISGFRALDGGSSKMHPHTPSVTPPRPHARGWLVGQKILNNQDNVVEGRFRPPAGGPSWNWRDRRARLLEPCLER